MNKKIEDDLGDIVDQLDNALALNKLGATAHDGVIHIIQSARAKAKALYVELFDDDPWLEFDALQAKEKDR